MNCIPPLPGFLEGLRRLCDEHGALLILDEVMTGFRVSLQGAQGYYGRHRSDHPGQDHRRWHAGRSLWWPRDVMEHLAPIGPVYQAGTLSGNPVAMAAGLAMLEAIQQPASTMNLNGVRQRIADGFSLAAERNAIPLAVNQVGGMFGFFFTQEAQVNTFAQVSRCDMAAFRRFYHLMLDEGVYLAPSAYEAGFLSMAHGDQEIEETLLAADALCPTAQRRFWR